MAVSRPLEQRTRNAQFSVRAICIGIVVFAAFLNISPMIFEHELTDCYEMMPNHEYKIRTMIIPKPVIYVQYYAICKFNSLWDSTENTHVFFSGALGPGHHFPCTDPHYFNCHFDSSNTSNLLQSDHRNADNPCETECPLHAYSEFLNDSFRNENYW